MRGTASGLFLLCVIVFLPATAPALEPSAVFEKTSNSVVVVLAMSLANQVQGQGSGFAVGNGQLIVTNNHVIGKSPRIVVRTQDGRELKAKPLSVDKDHDLAILGIQETIPPLPLMTASPSVGLEVVAIGNPVGLERTLSTGVVSGIRRMGEDFIVYQITAPLSPGSSGCPIMDTDGRVIGVAMFLIEGGQNLNFAVPSKYLLRIMRSGDAPSNSSSSTGPLEITKDDDGTIVIGQ